MLLRLYYKEKIVDGLRHNGYEEPVLQYWLESTSVEDHGKWVDVPKVYSDLDDE